MKSKIAVITDIHGNSSALKAVLNEIENDPDIQHIYCLGDMIAIGHESNEVLEQLYLREDISCVMGNHDEAIVQLLVDNEIGSEGEERLHHEWIADNLDVKFLPFLSTLPNRIECMIGNKQCLFVHYHLNEQGRFFPINSQPTATELDKIYEGKKYDLICFGHHHILHHFRSNQRIYLNPGALGCHTKPTAVYSTITIKEDGCIECSIKEVSYDNKKFLLDYDRLQVPARETLLRIFHGNQHL
ncbi:metallophosphoesterase family protein [Rossellomorea aquimaris]|uniref:metallophosphoesterase family protein n=1 Tax=Rossellomorea aquimaris TaxID=189382 RepID=UPI0007D095A5|nr:metallophosphoesterase family protein [Rossellomorea aquimaris]